MDYQMLVSIAIFVLLAVIYTWPRRRCEVRSEAASIFGQYILYSGRVGVPSVS